MIETLPRDKIGRFLQRTVKCGTEGCPLPGRYFIGDLEAEIDGREKFGHHCRIHDIEIAYRNAKIQVQAGKQGMTTSAYVEKLKKGGD